MVSLPLVRVGCCDEWELAIVREQKKQISERIVCTFLSLLRWPIRRHGKLSLLNWRERNVKKNYTFRRLLASSSSRLVLFSLSLSLHSAGRPADRLGRARKLSRWDTCSLCDHNRPHSPLFNPAEVYRRETVHRSLWLAIHLDVLDFIFQSFFFFGSPDCVCFVSSVGALVSRESPFFCSRGPGISPMPITLLFRLLKKEKEISRQK
jgi:hypothetical protein